MSTQNLKVIPLGGLGEIGKNMMALEYADDIIIIDAGLMFPSEGMLGVDLVIPDISYLRERQRNLRGMLITHGHEDHIGALPYIVPYLDLPIYAAKFTQKLISAELRQRGAKDKAKLNVVHSGSKLTLGNFKVEFFPVCHSIPDSMGLIIHTPLGVIVHTGDFKLDYTPIIAEPTDFGKIAQLGAKGVLLLFSDSTYAELAGYTLSERIVSDTLDHVMAEASGRVIITTFASLVSRIQQVIDAAAKHGRRVFILGRSMKEIANVALKMGYLTAPAGILCRLDELGTLPNNRVVLLATGSQGEPTSALVRMANRDPRSQVQIAPGDTVVISATPVPGNEALVNKTIDSLFRQGANVIYDKLARVHVHGHGSQEELKLLLNFVKPKFFVPVHGEYRHLRLHAKLAESLGMPGDNIFVLEDGDVLELGQEAGRIVDKIAADNVYVSGSATYDLDDAVLRDRRLLSQDGVVVITIAVDVEKRKLAGRPRVVARGFIGSRDGGALIEKCLDVVVAALSRDKKRLAERNFIEDRVRNSLADFFYKQIHRCPIIIPVITGV
ncbi:MAG: ribonuclease J [Dehalococcoidia bacterium]|nr:ribonuclease J [Dehalococcoidia bacterium]